MSDRPKTGRSEKLGALLRAGGAGALVVGALLAVFDPTPQKARALDVPGAGLRRADRFEKRHGPFPGARLTPMGVLDANGAPMELSVQNTPATVAEVLGHYERLFAQGNRHVDRNGDDEQGVASYYDDQVGALYSVQAIRGGQGREASTTVFTSIVDAPAGVRLAVEPPADFPSPEGLVTVLQIEDPNGSRVANQTVTQVARGEADEVAAYYRQELGARGWTLEAQSKQGEVSFLEMNRVGSRLQVTISPLVSEAAESLVTLVREGKGSTP